VVVYRGARVANAEVKKSSREPGRVNRNNLNGYRVGNPVKTILIKKVVIL